MEGEGYKGGELQEGSRTHLVPVRERDRCGQLGRELGAEGNRSEQTDGGAVHLHSRPPRTHGPRPPGLFAHPRAEGIRRAEKATATATDGR